MSVTKYDPADHGKIRTSLHIGDIEVSEDRSVARIRLWQRNQPDIEHIQYYVLNNGGSLAYMVDPKHMDRFAQTKPECAQRIAEAFPNEVAA